MEIFGVIISKEQSKEFCHLSKEEKRNWILKYTKQRNEDLITDFINNPPKANGKDCGCGCGGSKTKTDGNITSGVSQTITESSELVSNSGHDKGNSTKRFRKSKGQKD
jgi:hypothetical protein